MTSLIRVGFVTVIAAVETGENAKRLETIFSVGNLKAQESHKGIFAASYVLTLRFVLSCFHACCDLLAVVWYGATTAAQRFQKNW